MKRWNGKKNVENPKVDAFLDEVKEVCKKHKMSLSHEDLHGAFIVIDYDATFETWLEHAIDKTTTMKKS